MKILFIVIDGLGDEPIPQLSNKTPLESANTPNLDYFAEKGVSGLMTPCSTNKLPTSEEGHFSLFGYDPKRLSVKRGIFTAKGAGIRLKKGDVALRGNFAAIDEKMNMVDRRAGRIKNTKPLIKSLNGMVIQGVTFLLKPAGEHRVAVVMRGGNLSFKISDGDPHYSSLGKQAKKIVPLDKSLKAAFTAKVLNEFLTKSQQILKDHPINKKRRKSGLLQANYILTRGAGSLQDIPSFRQKYNLKACCVAGKLLYKQITQSLGMRLIRVMGANGLISTNLKGKISAARKALKKFDFVFLHIKAADSLAEDGDFLAKRKFIEKIDEHLGLIKNLENTLVVITGDHSTCSLLKRHCDLPIPVLVYGKNKDEISSFSEKDCQQGKLGKFKQVLLMKKIIRLAGD